MADRKPRNYFNELTPEQQKVRRELEAMAAETERNRKIAEAQRVFSPSLLKGHGNSNSNGDDPPKKDPIVKTITEDIMNRYRFVTAEENKEILVYDDGVYAQGGEVVIEKQPRAYTVTK